MYVSVRVLWNRTWPQLQSLIPYWCYCASHQLRPTANCQPMTLALPSCHAAPATPLPPRHCCCRSCRRCDSCWRCYALCVLSPQALPAPSNPDLRELLSSTISSKQRGLEVSSDWRLVDTSAFCLNLAVCSCRVLSLLCYINCYINCQQNMLL